jgi:GT2 family glycosyltransferase
MTKTGIILTTYNNLEMTKKALKSLMENTKNFELVIVDCASTDGTVEWVEQQGIQMIHFDKYVSLTEALNAGIRHFFDKEKPDLYYNICWIHNDMTFEKGWLEALEVYLDHNPKCGRVSSQNTRDSIEPERPGNELPCLIRGHVLKQIGLFDERFIGIGGREDWDLNKRILDNGFSVMITPTSRVYHVGMATRSQRNTDAEADHNAAVYFQKWGTYNGFV